MKTLITSLAALLLTAAPAAFAAPPSGQAIRSSPVTAPAARPAAQVSTRPQQVAKAPVAKKVTLSPSQLERRLDQLERELAKVKRSRNLRTKVQQQRVLEREIAQVERDLRTANRLARANQKNGRYRRG